MRAVWVRGSEEMAAVIRYATRLVPWIMIAIGAYILLDTPTDLL